MNPSSRSVVVRGGSPLKGTVSLGGAKNVALKVLPAAMLTDEPVTLRNMPVELKDVQTCLDMMESVGCRVDVQGDVIRIQASSLQSRVSLKGGRSIRTSTLFLPVLLSRTGAGAVPEPGGDAIGKRSYDLHVYALQALGAEVRTAIDGYVESNADSPLRGGPVDFRVRTTGGTETAILGAVLSEGLTEINNAHTRPEVRDLAGFLRSMGAQVDIPCSGLIRVNGVKSLHGTDYTIMQDPVEGFTYLTAAGITGGDVLVRDCPSDSLGVPLAFLQDSGVGIEFLDEGVRAVGPNVLGSVELAASPYPGVGTDFQPLFGALALRGQGRSRIMDLEFPERFEYAAELALNGADIEMHPGSVTVHGPTTLRRGAVLRAPDIRGGAALVLAALITPFQVRIENWGEIERGYVGLDMRLKDLGADIS